MTITSTQLWQRIAESRLASQAECRSWAGQIANDSGALGMNEPGAILAFLIRSRKLTPYQANLLMEDAPPRLVYGNHLIISPIQDGPFTEWLESKNLATQEQSATFLLDGVKLKGNRSWKAHPPSLDRARRMATIQSPYLLAWEEPVVESGVAAIIAKLPSKIEPIGFPVPWEKATEWMEQLAQGLKALHDSNLFHGRIHPNAIGLVDSQPVWICDPLFAPESPLVNTSPRSLEVLSTQHRIKDIAFAAPEFLVPGQMPTIATDLYALGILWYLLIAGKPPFDAKSDDLWMTAHVRQPIQLPQGIELPERLQKSILHLLAKNPKARFRTAEELLRAIRPDAEFATTSKVAAAPSTAPKLVQPVRRDNVPSSSAASSAKPTTKSSSTPADSTAAKPAANPSAPPAAPKVAADNAIRTVPSATPVTSIPEASLPPVQRVDPSTSGKNNRSSPLGESATPPVESSMQYVAAEAPKSQTSTATPAISSSTVSDKKTVKRAASTKKRSKKSQRPKWLMPVIGGVSFLGILALIVTLSRNKPDPNPDRKPVAERPTNPSNGPDRSVERDPLLDQFQVQNDDGRLAWVPPRPASPYSLEMIPPGAQAILFVKPDRWFGSKSGRTILELLEDPLQASWKEFQAAAGLPAPEAKEVAVAMYSGEGGTPKYAFRVELAKPKALSELKAAWGAGQSKKSQGGSLVYTGKDRSYFLASGNTFDADLVSRFSFGPSPLMEEVAELEGAAGPLRRQLESLWQTSDNQADLGLLVVPGFLFGDARPTLNQWGPRLEPALRKLLSVDVAGAFVSFSLDPMLYAELRVIGVSEKETLRAGKDIQNHFESLPDQAEAMLVQEPAHPYWRAIANRLPQMLRTMKQFQRFGIEQGHAITNVYLPSEASANLTLAAWMSIQQSTSPATVAATPTKNPTAEPMSIDDALSKPIDLVFDQQSLETAMNSIAEEINNQLSQKITFEIDGDAFEKEGITRNKEVRDFQFRQKPGRDALNQLVQKANPETTPSLNVESQKVVWITIEGAVPATKKIQITTRKAAAAINAKLPKEFVP